LSRTAEPGGAPAQPRSVTDFARATKPEDRAKSRDGLEEQRLQGEVENKQLSDEGRKAGADAAAKRHSFGLAKEALAKRRQDEVQTGKLGVDIAIQSNNLRNQSRLTPTAIRVVGGRNILEIGGVWIDDGFHSAMKTLTVRAQSAGYFRLLDRQPQVKDVFRLGNHVLWVTPSQTALVIDTSEGKDDLSDAEVDELFMARK
jgi:Ca-activated chloride channel family protein